MQGLQYLIFNADRSTGMAIPVIILTNLSAGAGKPAPADGDAMSGLKININNIIQ